MKPGHGKQKGNAFENKIAKELRLWLTKGAREDIFDRTSNSGGKATVHHKAGRFFGNLAGDLMAVGVEGHKLTSIFVIELKHQNEENLNLLNLIFQTADNGIIAYWKKLLAECDIVKKIPMLIFRQNSRAIYIALSKDGINLFQCAAFITASIKLPKTNLYLLPFTTFLTQVSPDRLTKPIQRRS